MGEIDRAVEAFPWHQRRAYADWLAQTYYYVRHSTRLLAAAAARFQHDERGYALHQRFGKHIGEEDRHELLALHDIKALGSSLDEFEERDVTRMFYEPQYYKVEHQDPLALFGYILPLEAVAVSKGGWVLARTDELYGRAAGTFLRVHAEDDVEHLDRAFAALSDITAQQQAIVACNLRQSTSAYVGILQALQQSYVSPGARAA
jgi:pyrroloquinoline quinone (PQQ) biosynthesis protein C